MSDDIELTPEDMAAIERIAEGGARRQLGKDLLSFINIADEWRQQADHNLFEMIEKARQAKGQDGEQSAT